MAIKAIINNTEKEIEQIKNNDEQDVDYVYSRIGDTEVEGEPPISIKSVGGNLADYRIYGQTSRNLFDGELVLGSFMASTGEYTFVNNRCISKFINVKSNTTYSLHITGAEITYIGYYGGEFSYLAPRIHDEFTFVTPNNCNQIRIVFSNYNNSIPIDLTVFPKNTIMLNSGSTPLPYEPYGESVGDRTGNLFDKTNFIQTNLVARADNLIVADPYTISTILPCNPNTKYTISKIVTNRFAIWGCTDYPTTDNYYNRRLASGNDSSSLTFTTGNDDNYLLVMLFYQRQPTDPTIEDVKGSLMFNYGEALPYEPYGYKVPVTVEGKNILPMSTTPISMEVDDFYCEYDGAGTITLTTDKDNAVLGGFSIPLSEEFIIPVSVGQGGDGCVQFNNSIANSVNTDTDHLRVNFWYNTTFIDDWGLTAINRINSTYSAMARKTINRVSIDINGTGFSTNRKIVIRPAFVLNTTEQVPFEPYHAPVTTPIYLPDQIRKVGDKAEYIDYGEQKFVKKFYKITLNFDDMNNDETFPGWSGGTAVVEYCNKIRSLAINTPDGYTPFQYSSISNFKANFNVRGNRSVLYLGVASSIGHTQSELKEIYAGRSITFILKIPDTELDVTLPALSTIKGTNTFSVNTSIQPSNMYIKDNFDYKKVFTATRTIEGESPLNYRSIEDSDSTLSNYRIYGQTVDGESVGDRTGNLFDIKTFAETCFKYSATVNYTNNTLTFTATGMDAYVNAALSTGVVVPLHYRSSCIDVLPSTTYTISMSSAPKCFISWVDSSFNVVSNFESIPTNATSYTFTTPKDCTKLLIRFGKYVTNIGDTFTISDIMLNSGLTALPYEPYGYKVPVTVSDGTDTLTTNLYLPEQIRKVRDEAEYVDYGEQKQYRVRKNLLPNTATSQTINGVAFTVNSDRSVTCNGTATQTAVYILNNIFSLEPGTYNLTGCPVGGEYVDKYKLDVVAPPIVYGTDIGAGSSFTLSSTLTNAQYRIIIYTGQTCDNLTFYPMIRKADIEDDTYEPYIENTEVDVTLPALPTLPETNTLSVETEIQPSKINIKGKIKGKIYGWHVNPDISDSSRAVTYLKDAIGMTPASMGFSTFNYGSWQNAFFMPKPCMLKSNGKVDYYLDPNDYTKKLDGTTSDISNPNYDGNAMMQWPKIWFKYVKGVKKGQGYFYVANYKADGNFHCWCNYDSENNEIDHFYTAIYNGTSFMNYNALKTYVVNDFAIYDNKLYKCNTAITTAESFFNNTKWDLVSNTAPAINKMRSLSGVRLTNNNGNAQTDTTTETTRATANNTTSAAEWYIETFSDRLLINGLLVLMGKSLNTQAVFGRGLDTGGLEAKEAYVTGALNDKGLFWGVTGNGNSGVKVFGMENFWGCCWHRTAGLITNNHAVKLKLTYGTKDGSTVTGYNQTGNGYIDNGTAPYSDGYVRKMSYNKYGFIPAEVSGGNQSTYYADYHYQNKNYTGTIYALFGGSSADGLYAGAFFLSLNAAPGDTYWRIAAASLSCKPLL